MHSAIEFQCSNVDDGDDDDEDDDGGRGLCSREYKTGMRSIDVDFVDLPNAPIVNAVLSGKGTLRVVNAALFVIILYYINLH